MHTTHATDRSARPPAPGRLATSRHEQGQHARRPAAGARPGQSMPSADARATAARRAGRSHAAAASRPSRGRQQDQRAGREPGDDDRGHGHEQQREPGPGDRGGPARRQPPDPGPGVPRLGSLTPSSLSASQGARTTRGAHRARNSPATPRMISPVRTGHRAEPQPDPAQQRRRRPRAGRPTGRRPRRPRASCPRPAPAGCPGAPVRARPNARDARAGSSAGPSRSTASVEIRPPPIAATPAGRHRVRQGHRDPVTAHHRRTQAQVAAQERQGDGQPEGQAQHEVDRAQQGHAGGREQREVGRHRQGGAEPGGVPAGQVVAEQVHRPGGRQQPTSAQGSRSQELAGLAHERGQCQDPGDGQRMPDPSAAAATRSAVAVRRDPAAQLSRECARAAPRLARTCAGRVRSPTGGRRRLRRARRMRPGWPRTRHAPAISAVASSGSRVISRAITRTAVDSHARR